MPSKKHCVATKPNEHLFVDPNMTSNKSLCAGTRQPLSEHLCVDDKTQQKYLCEILCVLFGPSTFATALLPANAHVGYNGSRRRERLLTRLIAGSNGKSLGERLPRWILAHVGEQYAKRR